MKFVIAADSFKGALDASPFCDAVEPGSGGVCLMHKCASFRLPTAAKERCMRYAERSEGL